MYKYSLRYGIISGNLAGLVMTTAFFLGIPTKGNPVLMLILLILIYMQSFMTIYHSRRFFEGEITFKNAFITSTASSMLYTIFFASYTLFYYTQLNPHFADKHLIDIEISLKHSGISAAEVQKQMSEWRADLTALNQTKNLFFGCSAFVIILSAINALILCKKD